MLTNPFSFLARNAAKRNSDIRKHLLDLQCLGNLHSGGPVGKSLVDSGAVQGGRVRINQYAADRRRDIRGSRVINLPRRPLQHNKLSPLPAPTFLRLKDAYRRGPGERSYTDEPLRAQSLQSWLHCRLQSLHARDHSQSGSHPAEHPLAPPLTLPRVLI